MVHNGPLAVEAHIQRYRPSNVTIGQTNGSMEMFRTRIVAAAILLVLILGSAMAQDRHPNIVYILADDFGQGSLGCYGAPPSLVKTPAIDSLAKGGMRFLDASAPSSICSPTRYAVLYGRYPWRTRMKFGVVNVADPLLPDPARPSLPAYLQSKGYKTAAIGKWHLGYGAERKQSSKDWTNPLTPGPLDIGFDYHFGVPQNHGDMTGIYIENDQIYGLDSDKVFPYSRSFYGSQYLGFDAPQRVNKDAMAVLTDKAVHWLENTANQPFFLFFTPVAVHHPITPSDAMRGESGCGPYGDFIQDLDRSVERILQSLDKLGVRNDTMVVFTSDNEQRRVARRQTPHMGRRRARPPYRAMARPYSTRTRNQRHDESRR